MEGIGWIMLLLWVAFEIQDDLKGMWPKHDNRSGT